MVNDSLDFLLEYKGLKYTDVSRALGVSRQTLWRIRRDPTRLKQDQILILAELLRLEPGDLNQIIAGGYSDEKMKEIEARGKK